MRMKKYLADIVTLFLVVSLFAAAVGFAGSTDEGEFSLKGKSMNADNTIEIEDWYDLDEVRDDLDGDYVLMNDLDKDTDGYDELVDTDKGWEPIGERNSDEDTEFTGTFDGNDHEVKDLYIDRSHEDSVGLFGASEEKIENIHVVDADVNGEEYVGGLVGWNSGTVKKSYVTGEVNGKEDVGALVGYNYEGTVSNSYATGDVSGDSDLGGLAGWNYGGTVENSSATGAVSGFSEVSEVGGLIGVNHNSVSKTGTVENSYATGEVSGESPVGGLVGYNKASVENSYATGEVSGELRVGPLVGFNDRGPVENSFWNIETTSQDESVVGTGLTTTEMTKKETFTDAGWDFEDTWDIIEGETYPFLQWQEEETYPYLEEPAEDEDDGIPGFTSLLLLVASIIAVAIYQKKKKR